MESEETTPSEEAETPQAAPMNRAEKRALAHKKGSNGAGGAAMPQSSAVTTGMGRNVSRAGNVRLPRTGHK